MTLPTQSMHPNMEMTEEEFAKELRQSLIILSTSSSDKRWIYRQLFTIFNLDSNKSAGLDAYYTDIGTLGIPPRITEEKTGEYMGNLSEKEIQLRGILQDKGNNSSIRNTLNSHENVFNPATIRIMGMTEDSGWNLIFETPEDNDKFLSEITTILLSRLEENNGKWLLSKIHETGFPGPNLKPLQEHLQGSFHEMMDVIYQAAEKAGITELRYSSTINVSFVSQNTGKYFRKEFENTGRVLSRQEYDERLTSVTNGEAVNSNFIHIPDGQANGEQNTLDVLIRNGLLTKPKAELPANHNRRDLAEYLQDLIGKRRSTYTERKRPVRTALVSTDPEQKAKSDAAFLGEINDLMTRSIPSQEELLEQPDIRVLGDADVVLLIPVKPKSSHGLNIDPNYETLVDLLVAIETDPKLMNVPLILDNRIGRFNNALALLTDAYAQGRLIGEPSMMVANNDDQLKNYLELVKDLKQRAPIAETDAEENKKPESVPLPAKIPHDGKFSVFIAGGHNNNSAEDISDAKALGYYCAQKGWRIVTGAGCLEGSMGAVHTGFIQYHLDNLRDKANPALNDFQDLFKHYDYDAQDIIKNHANELEELAKMKFIPRDMFYGYSMEALVKMESPLGNPPPAITYHDAGNMPRRLECLLAAGTKVFLHGGIGTDQEGNKTSKQHTAALKRKSSGVANNTSFADGTPDDQGAVFYHNRAGFYDKLLNEMNLGGEGPIAKANRRKNNVSITRKMETLLAGLDIRAKSWEERVQQAESDIAMLA